MQLLNSSDHFHRIIGKTLSELGIPNGKFSITDTTVVIRDGFYVGRSLVCGPVKVVVVPGGERIEFHDQNGSVFRLICLSQSDFVRKEAV